MASWLVTGPVTVTVITVVEAESEAEALEIARRREWAGAESHDEGWAFGRGYHEDVVPDEQVIEAVTT